MKEKIAISLSSSVLKDVDKRIDGSTIRSRSQAIEVLLNKALSIQEVNAAVLLLSRAHADVPQRHFKSSTVLEQQVSFLKGNGIRTVYAVSQADLKTELASVVRTHEKYNGDALRHAEKFIHDGFVVMSGDTYNSFNLAAMIAKHMNSGKLATIGLMSSPKPGKYGTAVLEGDLVTDFTEKPKTPQSNIINAGIYIFKPEVFGMMKGSIERNLLPRLAKKRQLVGYFTMGEYLHFGEIQS